MFLAEPNVKAEKKKYVGGEKGRRSGKGIGGRMRKEDKGTNLVEGKPNPEDRSLTKAEKQKRYRMEKHAVDSLFPTFSAMTLAESGKRAEDRAVELDVDAVSNSKYYAHNKSNGYPHHRNIACESI